MVLGLCFQPPHAFRWGSYQVCGRRQPGPSGAAGCLSPSPSPSLWVPQGASPQHHCPGRSGFSRASPEEEGHRRVAHGRCLWSPCKPMNSLRVLQFCVNIILSSLPLALFWSFNRLGICGSGLLFRCRVVVRYMSVWIYLHIFLFMKFSDSQDFHIAARILALVPVCVCGRVSFQGICLEMHPGGGGCGEAGLGFLSFSTTRPAVLLPQLPHLVAGV